MTNTLKTGKSIVRPVDARHVESVVAFPGGARGGGGPVNFLDEQELGDKLLEVLERRPLASVPGQEALFDLPPRGDAQLSLNLDGPEVRAR